MITTDAHRMPSGDHAYCVIVTVCLAAPTPPERAEDGSDIPSFTHYLRTLLVTARSFDEAAQHSIKWLLEHMSAEVDYPTGSLERIEISVVDPFSVKHLLREEQGKIRPGVHFTSGAAMFIADQYTKDREDLPETFARDLVLPQADDESPEELDPELVDTPAIVYIVKGDD